MTITLELKSHTGRELHRYPLNALSPLRITAQDHVMYQLVDERSYAPESVRSQRNGDDLLIEVNGEQTVAIEGYFSTDPSGLRNPLTAIDAQGHYFSYPIGEAPFFAEHLLASEIVSQASLPTVADTIPVAGLLAGLLGVSAIGVAAGRSSDKELPAASLPDENIWNLPQDTTNTQTPNMRETAGENTVKHALGIEPQWENIVLPSNTAEDSTAQFASLKSPAPVALSTGDTEFAPLSAQASILPQVRVTQAVYVSDAAAVKEGGTLQYTVKLGTPAVAGQKLRIDTIYFDSTPSAQELPQIADPFRPGEYLANGTVFTRNVDNMPIAWNNTAIKHHIPSLIQTGVKPTALNTEAFNIPIYIVDSSDPRQHYAKFISDDKRVMASKDIIDHTMGKIPIPDYAKPAAGGDRSFAVYDKATSMMREYFQAEKLADGTWKVASAGYYQAQPGLEGLDLQNFWMQLTHGSSSVVGMLNPLSQIGISEVLAGKINHAVSVTLPNARRGVFSFPAKNQDGEADSMHAPVEGQWFRIPKFDPNTGKPINLDTYVRNGKPLGPLTRMIAKAVQEYGGYGADKNKHSFAFNAESSYNYLANGKADPWRDDGEIALKLGGSKPLDIADFPWELVQWAQLDWDARGQNRPVQMNEQTRAIYKGKELPLRYGEIELPVGAQEITLKVPAPSHNNMKQTNSVTLKVTLLQNGKIIASDDGSGGVYDASPVITDVTHGTPHGDLLISPDINPAHADKISALRGKALYDYLEKYGNDILSNPHRSPASPVLDAGDGNDILISGYGVDHMRGGKGADTFVYIMQGNNSFPFERNDQILDYNPHEGDRIILLKPDDWVMHGGEFKPGDKNEIQRLEFKVFQHDTFYVNAVKIQSGIEGKYFTFDEIMPTVSIL